MGYRSNGSIWRRRCRKSGIFDRQSTVSVRLVSFFRPRRTQIRYLSNLTTLPRPLSPERYASAYTLAASWPLRRSRISDRPVIDPTSAHYPPITRAFRKSIHFLHRTSDIDLAEFRRRQIKATQSIPPIPSRESRSRMLSPHRRWPVGRVVGRGPVGAPHAKV